MFFRIEIRKDFEKRIKYEFKEIEYFCLKWMRKDERILKEKRFIINGNLSVKLMKKKVFRTKIRNMCLVTGRMRGVLKEFRMSRLVFKREFNKGLLPSISVSSW